MNKTNIFLLKQRAFWVITLSIIAFIFLDAFKDARGISYYFVFTWLIFINYHAKRFMIAWGCLAILFSIALGVLLLSFPEDLANSKSNFIYLGLIILNGIILNYYRSKFKPWTKENKAMNPNLVEILKKKED